MKKDHRVIPVWILLSIAFVALPLTAAIKGPVKTKGGQVSGIPGSDLLITAFKGIPFCGAACGRRGKVQFL